MFSFQLCEAAIGFSLTSTVNTVTLTWTGEDGHGYNELNIELDGSLHGDPIPGSDFNTGGSEEMLDLISGTLYTVVVLDGIDEIWWESIYTGKLNQR